jgi:redox-sensitive bicupin YhaK (pirin superfamily)
MLEVQRATERYRGGDPAAGIDTRHAFSFSGFYAPDNVRFGPLTACNEERLDPGAGFAEHPHRDIEIVTWVLSGELTHEDSTGQATVIRPGDVQRLSAGSGARHLERNDGPEPLRFLQMWLVPQHPGGVPEYEVVRGIADATPYALPRTDAVLHTRRLAPGTAAEIPDADRVYLHVARGAVRLTTADPVRLAEGDAARLTAPAGLVATAEPAPDADGTGTGIGALGAELLIWELGTA